MYSGRHGQALGKFLLAVREDCAKEMQVFGMPNGAVQDIIMPSNFSKFGADGEPIYDERDKVMKGPNYRKPEPKIKALLKGLMDPVAAA